MEKFIGIGYVVETIKQFKEKEGANTPIPNTICLNPDDHAQYCKELKEIREYPEEGDNRKIYEMLQTLLINTNVIADNTIEHKTAIIFNKIEPKNNPYWRF